MKKKRSLLRPTLIFILGQIACIGLLGLWIYWYVTNYVLLSNLSKALFTQIDARHTNEMLFVFGIIFLTAILIGASLIFVNLSRQVNITRMYDNFIANVTHELKSPLASIKMYLDTLLIRDVPKNRIEEFLTLMIEDADRLESLINAILEISRLEQTKKIHNFQIHSTKELANSLIREASRQFKLQPDAVRIRGGASCSCVADKAALQIVINNLFDNAIKYSNDPVSLDIKLDCTQTEFTLEITDQGIGIPVKDQKKIFKKFHRLDNPLNPSVKGTGLGLYWVKEIIDFHHGRIDVQSNGRNCGTTFKIILPISRKSKIERSIHIKDRREQEKRGLAE